MYIPECYITLFSHLHYQFLHYIWFVVKSVQTLAFERLAIWKCAETEILIKNSEEDQYLSWREFGLNLHIAGGSLPPDCTSCTIHIIATTMGDYQFPPNSHLVSAVYWINCVSACDFVKPVILEIQHCGKSENLTKLYFAKASSVQSNQEHSYVFHRAQGCSNTSYGIFPALSSHGFILLKRFCGFCVLQNYTEERMYITNSYYFGQGENQWKIHMNISWNTSAHRSVSLWWSCRCL